MAFVRKDMESIIKKYGGFGYIIFYLCEKEKIEKEIVEASFLKLNPEIADLYLKKIKNSLKEVDMDEAYLYASSMYSKSECIKDYFGISEGKLTLRKDLYDTALNYFFMEKLLKKIKERHEDVGSRRIINSYLVILSDLVNDMKNEVMKKSITRR